MSIMTDQIVLYVSRYGYAGTSLGNVSLPFLEM
jgi:hypothetical protein